MSNTYCVVFFIGIVFLRLVASFFGLFILDCPFGILSSLFRELHFQDLFVLVLLERKCQDIVCLEIQWTQHLEWRVIVYVSIRLI